MTATTPVPQATSSTDWPDFTSAKVTELPGGGVVHIAVGEKLRPSLALDCLELRKRVRGHALTSTGRVGYSSSLAALQLLGDGAGLLHHHVSGVLGGDRLHQEHQRLVPGQRIVPQPLGNDEEFLPGRAPRWGVRPAPASGAR